MREADRLSDYLTELERSSWTLAEYFAAHPELSDEMRCGLYAAGRIRAARRPRPSAAFRARSRARLVTFIQAEARRDTPRGSWRRALAAVGGLLRPLFAPIAAALLVVGGGAGVWSASASALPESPLYAAKLAFERVELLVAFTSQQQLAAHLNLAEIRLQEADAEKRAGNRSSVDALLLAFDQEVAAVKAIAALPSPGQSSDLQAYASGRIALLQSTRQSLSGPVFAIAETKPVAPTIGQPTGPSIILRASAPSAVLPDPSKIQPNPGQPLMADPSSDGLNRALAAASNEEIRVTTAGPLPSVVVVQSPRFQPTPFAHAASPAAPSRSRSRPAPVDTPIPVAPTPVPAAPVSATPLPEVPTPIPVIGGPPSTGGSQNPPRQQLPPPLPTPIGNPSIPVPIIVHNPTRLPSPALTGHKPVVTPPIPTQSTP